MKRFFIFKRLCAIVTFFSLFRFRYMNVLYMSYQVAGVRESPAAFVAYMFPVVTMQACPVVGKRLPGFEILFAIRTFLT